MRLTSIQRLIAYASFFSLLLSGIVWLLVNFYLNNSSPWRFLNAWSLKLHGLSTFIFLIISGMILSTHISFNWRVKKNRRQSGVILTAIFAALILSGYFLYYLGDENWRNFMSYFHWVTGIVCAIFFISHLKVKRHKTTAKLN